MNRFLKGHGFGFDRNRTSSGLKGHGFSRAVQSAKKHRL